MPRPKGIAEMLLMVSEWLRNLHMSVVGRIVFLSVIDFYRFNLESSASMSTFDCVLRMSLGTR